MKFSVYCSLLTSNYHFYMQSKVFQVYCSLLTSNYHFYMQSENFKCNVLYLPPIITFTCKSVIIGKCKFSTEIQLSLLHAIWNFQCSMFSLTAKFTFTCNLKFSSVLFSTDIQLSLLHAISNFQVYCSLLTSEMFNYHFYMQSEIFKCNVLYLPPIITFTCQSMKSDIIITFTWIWKFQV